MTVALCTLISNTPVEDLEMESDGEEEISEERKPVAVLEAFLSKAFKLFRRALSPELDKSTFSRNEYMGILLDALGLQSRSIEEESLQVIPEAIQRCKELNEMVFHQIKPIPLKVYIRGLCS